MQNIINNHIFSMVNNLLLYAYTNQPNYVNSKYMKWDLFEIKITSPYWIYITLDNINYIGITYNNIDNNQKIMINEIINKWRMLIIVGENNE